MICGRHAVTVALFWHEAGSRQQWPSTSSTWSGKSHAKRAFEQHCLHLASDELSFRATGKSCHSWVSCRLQRPSTSSPSSDGVKPLAGVEAVAARDDLTFRLTESHTRGCRAGSSDSRRPFLPAMAAGDVEAVATSPSSHKLHVTISSIMVSMEIHFSYKAR